jgi:hypothetical protein
MDLTESRNILNNLYGLLMEMNFHEPDEDVLQQFESKPDSQILKHLMLVKQHTAKIKADINKRRFQALLDQFNLLKQNGLDEFKKLIRPEEQSQLIPLFHKFEGMSKEDEQDILNDQELLLLIKILKERSGNSSI